MIAEIIGAAIGADLDEQDSTVGALIGVAAAFAIKRALPLMVIGAGVLVARHYLKGSGEAQMG